MTDIVLMRLTPHSGYPLMSQGPAVDGIVSAVWTQRWQGYGEAVIVLPPGSDVQIGEFLHFPVRRMAVEVVRREETQKGVTLRCRDALAVLDRRVISPTVSNDGLISTFVTKMLTQDKVVRTDAATSTQRTLGPVYLGDLSAIQGSAAVQRSNRPMGEVLLELGRAYGFDPRMRLGVYSAQDREWALYVDAAAPSGMTRTWGLGAGLSGFRTDDDVQAYRNVAVVGGQERDGARVTAFAWSTASEPMNLNRREEFVDRRDVPIGGMDRASVVEQYGDLSNCGALTATTVTSGASAPYSVEDVRMTVEMTAGGVAVTASALLRDVLSASAWASCAADCSTADVSKTYTRKA
jgi:hypothetical protein